MIKIIYGLVPNFWQDTLQKKVIVYIRFILTKYKYILLIGRWWGKWVLIYILCPTFKN